MPITIDALRNALTAGIIEYDTNSLELTTTPDGDFDPRYNKLLVQIFSSAVITNQNLQSGSAATTAKFTTPTVDPTGTGTNYKVKSYLNAPVVCSVGGSGGSIVSRIAFALVHHSGVHTTITPTINETTFSAGTGNMATTLTPATTGEETTNGDVFMVITVSPGITVTGGGYLTVKGWANGVTGSDSHTYITLQSGS